MLLGDVIARFDDEAFAGETLFALDDLALTARVAALAVEKRRVGRRIRQAVGRALRPWGERRAMAHADRTNVPRGKSRSGLSAARAVECVGRTGSVVVG